ncbi:19303_t:CDS:2, partial [Dentiscutata erythropus]
IIRASPNLRHLEIGSNDIGDKVTEALAHTCHKLEYLDLKNFDEDYYCFDSESSSSETKSKSESSSSESEDEVIYYNNLPHLIIMDSPDSPNNFISTFSDFLRQNGGANNNFISAFLNQELAQCFLAEQWYSTDLTNPTLWSGE